MAERIWLMSAYATILIMVVLGIRGLLKSYSKVYCYSLWILVIIRLVCPIFLTSNLGVHNYIGDTVNQVGIRSQDVPTAHTQGSNLNVGKVVSNMEMDRGDSIDIMEAMKIVWILGIVLVGSTYLIQYVGLKRRLQTAIKDERNIWLSDRIDSPFVFGLFRPRIYLPYGMKGKEREYIIKHESTHIKHKDAWIRVLGTLAICLHWWNPAVWYCIHKVNQDMEMFCDETVLRNATEQERKEYAGILLLHSIKRSEMSLVMAFGESNTEKRVKHICKGKKRKCNVTIMMAMTIATLVVFFGTLPKQKAEGSNVKVQGLTKPIEFTGGDAAFGETLGSSPEDARAFLQAFYTSVANGEKEKVASMMAYPRMLDTGQERITIQNESELIKHYDVIFTSKFKNDLRGWLEEEVFYNYMGMCLSDGQVWISLGENGWFIDGVDNTEGVSIRYDFPLSW